MAEKMFLTRGSAEVDWCESNYAHNIHVAEFYNTISCIPLTILPIFGYYFNKTYADRINPNIKYVFYLFIFVGFSSAYFHATLSLLGQLLDELSLLWIGALSYVVWLPRMRSTPSFVRNHLYRCSVAMLIAAIVSTALSAVHPAINAYLLMLMCIPIFFSMYYELLLANDPNANALGFQTTIMWSIGVSVWISDRTMCDIWIQIGFPYFHAVWHLFSAYASYCCIVLFSYLDATIQAPSMKPKIRYYPRNYFFKVPFLYLSEGADAPNGFNH